MAASTTSARTESAQTRKFISASSMNTELTSVNTDMYVKSYSGSTLFHYKYVHCSIYMYCE